MVKFALFICACGTTAYGAQCAGSIVLCSCALQSSVRWWGFQANCLPHLLTCLVRDRLWGLRDQTHVCGTCAPCGLGGGETELKNRQMQTMWVGGGGTQPSDNLQHFSVQALQI